eukprot:s3433_g3.t1
MMLSDEPPPYRVENWPLTWCAFDWPVHSKADRDRRLVLQELFGDEGLNIRKTGSYRARRSGSGGGGSIGQCQCTPVVVVLDLATHRKEMYEAEKVGPGRPLKLDEGQEVNGQSAPLSEEGYHEVVLLQEPWMCMPI